MGGRGNLRVFVGERVFLSDGVFLLRADGALSQYGRNSPHPSRHPRCHLGNLTEVNLFSATRSPFNLQPHVKQSRFCRFINMFLVFWGLIVFLPVVCPSTSWSVCVSVGRSVYQVVGLSLNRSI